MRARAIALLILLSICIVAPAYAANEDRYSDIKVSDIAVQLTTGRPSSM